MIWCDSLTLVILANSSQNLFLEKGQFWIKLCNLILVICSVAMTWHDGKHQGSGGQLL